MAVPLLQEMLSLLSARGNPMDRSGCARPCTRTPLARDYRQAVPIWEECLCGSGVGDVELTAWCLVNRAGQRTSEATLSRCSLVEVRLSLYRALDAKGGIAWMIETLAWVALEQDDDRLKRVQ